MVREMIMGNKANRNHKRLLKLNLASKSELDNGRNSKHKKMKYSDDKVRDSCSSIFNHYGILLEILSWLPVKSLMRFKCVSKHWRFIICQDQCLIDLHFTRSKQHCPDLFIVVPSYTKVEISKRNWYVGMRDYKYKQSVLLGNLFESRTLRASVTRLEQESFCYTEILDPVNGLICFVNRRLAAVRILNPSTRESTPWIASSLRQNKKYNFIADYSCGIWLPTYFLGFDPVTKQHKVLCTWRVRGPVTRNSNVVKIGQDIQWADFCEVLTIGENTWRYIEEKVPFSYTVKFSVYANGFIYWGKQSIGIPEVLNAFDVGQEKFKVIQVPQEIRDKCEDPPGGDTFGPFDSLTDVGGHIALLQRWSDKVVKLWICGDDTSTGSYSKWTEITMELPFNWGGRHGRYPYFHGVAGEDRIIIESYPTVTRDITNVSLYSYDWKEKTSTKKAKSGVVTKLGSASLFSKLASANLFRSFTASLWPVRKVPIQTQPRNDQ